jgi:photosystem II stability/assembly factor-like uncharacterized protein
LPYATLSTDGGRTWKPVTDTTTPVASVAADGWIESRPSAADPRRAQLWAVDPHTARAAPLAHQPGIELQTDRPAANVPLTAGIWVSGRDPAANRGAVAASHDGGRTWSVRVFTDHSTDENPPGIGSQALVTTRDGRTAYTILYTQPTKTYVYRSVDGGATWQQRTSEPLPEACRHPGVSYVARDGAHVLMVEIAPARFCVSRDGGVTYALSDAVTGLHEVFGWIQPVNGGYLARGKASDAFYWSGDGFRFTELSIR